MIQGENYEERFTALRIISFALKVVAIVFAFIGAISAIASLFTGVSAIAILGTFLAILIATAVQFIITWAISEMILLLISIEHNTYQTKEYLAQTEIRKAA